MLTEAMKDPIGTPGLMFSLIDYAARLSAQVAADFREQLRAALFEAVRGHESDEEHPGQAWAPEARPGGCRRGTEGTASARNT
jgi:hypothetical protein